MGLKNLYRVKVFLKDKKKKNIFLIVKEIFLLFIKKKEIPFYYFKHLYKKEITNIYDYLGTKEGARIHTNKELHKVELTTIMNNKLAYTLFSEINAIKTPKLYGYNLKNQYFTNGKMISINNEVGLKEYFKTLFNHSSEDYLFVKPLAEFGGKGCFVLSLENMTQQISINKKALLTESHLFSEVVQQHQAINEIHAKSLNTLRLITYITDTESIEIVSAFMRFGTGDSVVDNGSSGGLYLGINTEEGCLRGKGYRTMKNGGEEFTHHPNNNYKLDGFKIPFFKEACELVISTVEHIPDRWIGWDVAITPNGPLIIEANDCPDLHMSDVANEGLLKNAHIKNLVDNLNKKS